MKKGITPECTRVMPGVRVAGVAGPKHRHPY